MLVLQIMLDVAGLRIGGETEGSLEIANQDTSM